MKLKTSELINRSNASIYRSLVYINPSYLHKLNVISIVSQKKFIKINHRLTNTYPKGVF